MSRVYLKTPDAPGQRAFSRRAASFFLEIRQYSCEKMSCAARKFLAAGHIGSFQIHPRGFFYRLTDRSNVRFGEVFAAADPRLFLLKPFHLVNSRKLDLLIFQYFCQPFVADTGSICVKTDIGRSLRIECDAPPVRADPSAIVALSALKPVSADRHRARHGRLRKF